MNIIKTMKAISYQFEANRAIKDAVKFSKQRQKMKTDKFVRRFSATDAGYFPKKVQKGFLQKLFKN